MFSISFFFSYLIYFLSYLSIFTEEEKSTARPEVTTKKFENSPTMLTLLLSSTPIARTIPMVLETQTTTASSTFNKTKATSVRESEVISTNADYTTMTLQDEYPTTIFEYVIIFTYFYFYIFIIQKS